MIFCHSEVEQGFGTSPHSWQDWVELQLNYLMYMYSLIGQIKKTMEDHIKTGLIGWIISKL